MHSVFDALGNDGPIRYDGRLNRDPRQGKVAVSARDDRGTGKAGVLGRCATAQDERADLEWAFSSVVRTGTD